MAMDTGTVRLVIFLGMFLVFAGDYTTVISAIFGNVHGGNDTVTARRLQGPPRDDQRIKRATSDKLTSDKLIFDEESVILRRAKTMETIKTACLPKLICELTSTANQDQLSAMERSLLNLIRDTSLNTMAEVTSRYHFAAHMGQLIAGIEGQGCHNFYPTCPLPGSSVLNMMKKIRVR